jgi:hypothetical protein
LDLTVNGDETVQPAPFRLDAGISGLVQAAKVKKKKLLKNYLSITKITLLGVKRLKNLTCPDLN